MKNERPNYMPLSSVGDFLDPWVISLLADPITKQSCPIENFKTSKGIVDARVLLKNSYGFSGWLGGQEEFEVWEAAGEGYKNEVDRYKNEIEYDRPIYEHFEMAGSILDVGGALGTVREFLPDTARFVSVDPFIYAPFNVPSSKREAYSCLSRRLNFLAALAEFLPFQKDSFDWVHMRSMLDHVQVPDLALIETHRVLKPGGQLLVGLLVEEEISFGKTPVKFVKGIIKEILGHIGFERWQDHHTWHPTYKNLLKLISDNRFSIEDTYWQPHWNHKVVYIRARKQV